MLDFQRFHLPVLAAEFELLKPVSGSASRQPDGAASKELGSLIERFKNRIARPVRRSTSVHFEPDLAIIALNGDSIPIVPLSHSELRVVVVSLEEAGRSRGIANSYRAEGCIHPRASSRFRPTRPRSGGLHSRSSIRTTPGNELDEARENE